MSSNTHLTALSLLQTEFGNGSKVKLRSLRLTGMLILGIMLLVALVPTAGANWNNFNSGKSRETILDLSAAGTPAICLWQPSYSTVFWAGALWSFIILIVSYMLSINVEEYLRLNHPGPRCSKITLHYTLILIAS